MAGADAADSPVQVASDEVILRRLLRPRPGSPATVHMRPGVGLTATSFSLRPRPGEFPSWSRKRITSPEMLLRLASEDGCDIRGAAICEVRVGMVRGLGLDVAADPTPRDAGHCVIVPTARQPFSDVIWKKLANCTRVIYQHPDTDE